MEAWRLCLLRVAFSLLGAPRPPGPSHPIRSAAERCTTATDTLRLARRNAPRVYRARQQSRRCLGSGALGELGQGVQRCDA